VSGERKENEAMRRILCFLGIHRWRVWAVQPRKAIVLGPVCGGWFRCCDVCGKVADDTKHWSGEPTESCGGFPW
jgi:hypothetical protein